MISIGYFCQSLKLDPSVFSELKKLYFAISTITLPSVSAEVSISVLYFAVMF